MTLKLGQWAKAREAFRAKGVPMVAGISGGRTSGMMAALLDDSAVMTFENTGREGEGTYVFLERLSEALGREIIWLEYRPPKKGDRPCNATFEIVNPRTASRDGRPFRELLAALADYRATIGKGPVAPWARARLCTAYLKEKTQRKYIDTLGWTKWTTALGLRADEPDRVGRLRSTRAESKIAPLASVGITKQDVNTFWGWQSFDLELSDYQGNCTGCFLKDQSDLARALTEPGTDPDWWIKMENMYPQFGGRNFPGYKTLLLESPHRVAIESAIRNGDEPVNTGLDPRRFKLVVIQERKRIAGEIPTFSCACEGSGEIAAMDEDEEDDFISRLPEAE